MFQSKLFQISLIFVLVNLSACYTSDDYFGIDQPNALILKLDNTTFDFSQNLIRTDNNGSYFAREPKGQLFDSSGEGGSISFNVDSPNDFAESYLNYVNGNMETYSSLHDSANLEIVIEKFGRDTYDCDNVCIDEIVATFSGTIFSESGDSLVVSEGLLFFEN